MLLLADLQPGNGEYGSFDAGRILGGLTKMTTVAQTPTQAVQQTQLAIKHALSGECGPVAVLYSGAALSGTIEPDSRPRLYSRAPNTCRVVQDDVTIAKSKQLRRRCGRRKGQ